MMNNSCIEQPNEATIILNDGEEGTGIVDSQTGFKNANICQSLNDDQMCGDQLVNVKRDGDVRTAGDSPLPDTEEMGVAREQLHSTAGQGQGGCTLEQVDLQTKERIHGIINNSNADIDLSTCGSDDGKITISKNKNMSNHESDGNEHEHDCDKDVTSNESNSNGDKSAINCHENIPEFHHNLTLQGGSSQVLNSEEERTQKQLQNHTDVIAKENVFRTSLSQSESIPSSSSSICNQSELNNPQGSQICTNIEQKSIQSCDNESCDVNSDKLMENASVQSQQTSSSPGTDCEEFESTDTEVRSPCVSTRSQELVAGAEAGNHSPATIDVTSSEEWEDASADIPTNLTRPHFFPQNITDLSVDPISQQSSESPSVWSNPITLSFPSTPGENSSSAGSSPHKGGSDVAPSLKTTPSGAAEESSNTPIRSRTSTSTSLGTDFSSNVSIATDELNEAIADGLVLGEEDVDFVEVNLEHGEAPPGATVVGSGAKPKKKGLGGFLSRNIFRKSLGKSSHPLGTDSPPGWKLFGRVPAKETMRRDHMQISEDFQKRGQTHPPTSSLTWKKRHTGLKEASSTTALILENRPEYLPAKNPEEEEKHKEEYTKMLKEAKKKELKLYKMRLKKISQQLKYEDGIKSSLHVWQQEILPKWDEVKKQKKTRDLWWQGIPPSVRGRIWMLAIKNELNITDELFEIFLIRAKDRIRMCSESESEGVGLEEIHAASRENSVDVIKLDVARTFPQLCIFQKGGPYFDLLHSVLGAYACYRPDVGYVQGMSFIAAVFLLYLEVADAFICFANLLNKSCQLAFFRLDQPVMQSYFSVFEEYFQECLPKLYSHFEELGISPDLYIIDWMYTLYSKSLPLDLACRVWDVFFRDGEEFLFKTALGILSLYEDVLHNMDFIQSAQFLTNIPVDIDSDKLFKHIDGIDTHHQKKFGQVLIQHMSANLANQSGNS